MIKTTKRELKQMVKSGRAIDVTNAKSVSEIPERYRQIAYSSGVYGCTGMLLQGESGQLYAVTDRTGAIYIF